MIRIVTLAAIAAFAAAAPASAHQVRISLVGKSAAQVDAEVARAARLVCMRDTSGETLRVDAYGRCVRETTKVAQAKLASVQAD